VAKITVIGAGPAGCSAGYHLAKSGHQVTLIDKSGFPRDKVCGDGISLESVQALSTMGIYPQDLRQRIAEYARVMRPQQPKITTYKEALAYRHAHHNIIKIHIVLNQFNQQLKHGYSKVVIKHNLGFNSDRGCVSTN